MGLFRGNQEKSKNLALEEARQQLVPCDGGMHVLMMVTKAEWNPSFSEPTYNREINSVLDMMQAQGYAIVDVKFTPMESHENDKLMYYSTLISYK